MVFSVATLHATGGRKAFPFKMAAVTATTAILDEKKLCGDIEEDKKRANIRKCHRK